MRLRLKTAQRIVFTICVVRRLESTTFVIVVSDQESVPLALARRVIDDVTIVFVHVIAESVKVEFTRDERYVHVHASV